MFKPFPSVNTELMNESGKCIATLDVLSMFKEGSCSIDCIVTCDVRLNNIIVVDDHTLSNDCATAIELSATVNAFSIIVLVAETNLLIFLCCCSTFTSVRKNNYYLFEKEYLKKKELHTLRITLFVEFIQDCFLSCLNCSFQFVKVLFNLHNFILLVL